MRQAIHILSILSLTLSLLGAADLIRPKQVLTPIAGGIQVDLDLQHISEMEWRNLLAHPQSFHKYGYGVAGAPGEAALPMLTMMIPVSSTAMLALETMSRSEIILDQVELKSSPAGHLDSDQPAMQISAFDWNRSGRSQFDEIMIGEAVYLQGQQFLPVTLHPVQLDPVTRSLRILSRLTFELHGAELTESVQMTQDGGIRSISLPEDQFALKGHYLIITPPTFATYIQYFVEWKRRQGYQVTVVNTTVSGSSANTIKAYLQNAWDSWESRPNYLVLVGDEDQGVPGHYIQNPQGDYLVTDHPYALLEGDDSFPELMVGRLSVDTSAELMAFTGKIIAYERNPSMTDTGWFQRALMISTTWGAASAQATKEWVAAKLIENGFQQVSTAYHPAQSNPGDIANPINQGVSYVNYRCFGMYNGWYGPDFTSDDVQNMINNGPRTPVITSVVCGGGNFAANYDDPCFGETWTRIGTMSNPRGAVAFFGPSELYTHTQFNNVIDIGIYSGIFDLGIRTLGEALWNGKLELWRNYHQNTYFPFGQTPEFYHHIYNLLGDPGLQLWTGVPQLMTVDHVGSLTTGDNSLLVSVTSETGAAIADAYVALYNSEHALGGFTDANGQITLPFQADTESTVDLTITGTNLYPYLATLPINAVDHRLELNTWTLDEGGYLVAGNSWPMSISCYNPGAELSDVILSFSSTSPGIEVDETVTIASIASHDSYFLNTINITPSVGIAHGTPVNIALEVQAGEESWTWHKNFVVQAPIVRINALNLVDGNLAPGDSALVAVEVMNLGGAETGPLEIVPLEHALVDFTTDPMLCPSVGVDGIETTESLLQLIFNDQVFPGEIITLQFECTMGSILDTLQFDLQIGDVSPYGPSQADEWGYRVFDSFDLSYTVAPSFDWAEMDPEMGGSGTVLPLNDIYEELDASTTVDLPFPVVYYGQVYDQITICTNGWAAFGDQDVVNFHNRTIPSIIGPVAMLAPYWDDLVTVPGLVAVGTSADADQFIIEWSRVSSLGGNNELSFQIVLYDVEEHPTLTGDSEIKFQYNTYDNLDIEANFSTIGIEAPDERSGLLVSYNNIYNPSIGMFLDRTALLFSTNRGERLPDGLASLNTLELSFSQNPWSTGTDSIVITNLGETPVAYNFNFDSELNSFGPPIVYADQNLSKSSGDVISNPTDLREGSDAYGYTWRKSDEADGPVYNWINIAYPEFELAYTGDPDDGSIGPVDLGFEFSFYDDIYSSMYIGSNGTITFESVYSPWLNQPLPSYNAPAALIAPWWEDLNNESGPLGTIYFWTNDQDQCIITWQDFPKWGTDEVYTFQVLLNIFGSIDFQYETMDGPTYSSTVGQQSSEQNVGLLIHYNENTAFEAGTAISIKRPVNWFAASGWSGQIGPGESGAFVVEVQTQNLDIGHYNLPLTLTTSAINMLDTPINVSLDVVLGEHPSGDVNGDYLLNINDVMLMMDYILLIEDMNEDQFLLADMSADDAVDIIDVVLLVEAILDFN